MSDTFSINEHDQVVPYTSGRRCNDTREWRDATDLELQQRDDISGLERDNQKLLDRVTELEAKLDLPPEGYPSWEDWLWDEGVEIRYLNSAWFVLRKDAGQWLPNRFPDYPTALAAAKKEAGR